MPIAQLEYGAQYQTVNQSPSCSNGGFKHTEKVGVGGGRITHLNKTFKPLIMGGADTKKMESDLQSSLWNPTTRISHSQPEGRHHLLPPHWAFCVLCSVGIEEEIFGKRKKWGTRIKISVSLSSLCWKRHKDPQWEARKIIFRDYTGRLSSLRAFETLKSFKNWPAQVVLKQFFLFAEKSCHQW